MYGIYTRHNPQFQQMLPHNAAAKTTLPIMFRLSPLPSDTPYTFSLCLVTEQVLLLISPPGMHTHTHGMAHRSLPQCDPDRLAPCPLLLHSGETDLDTSYLDTFPYISATF